MALKQGFFVSGKTPLNDNYYEKAISVMDSKYIHVHVHVCTLYSLVYSTHVFFTYTGLLTQLGHG